MTSDRQKLHRETRQRAHDLVARRTCGGRRGNPRFDEYRVSLHYEGRRGSNVNEQNFQPWQISY